MRSEFCTKKISLRPVLRPPLHHVLVFGGALCFAWGCFVVASGVKPRAVERGLILDKWTQKLFSARN
jgi:hypothetical protein